MKKIILSTFFFCAIMAASDKSPEKIVHDETLKKYLAKEIESLDNKIFLVDKINCCLIGVIAGIATGGACAIMDNITKGKVLLLAWLSMVAIRPIIINYCFKNMLSGSYFKERNKLITRRQLASLVGDATAWALYINMIDMSLLSKR